MVFFFFFFFKKLVLWPSELRIKEGLLALAISSSFFFSFFVNLNCVRLWFDN